MRTTLVIVVKEKKLNDLILLLGLINAHLYLLAVKLNEIVIDQRPTQRGLEHSNIL